jgi:hypothetical protein
MNQMANHRATRTTKLPNSERLAVICCARCLAIRLAWATRRLAHTAHSPPWRTLASAASSSAMRRSKSALAWVTTTVGAGGVAATLSHCTTGFGRRVPPRGSCAGSRQGRGSHRSQDRDRSFVFRIVCDITAGDVTLCDITARCRQGVQIDIALVT